MAAATAGRRWLTAGVVIVIVVVILGALVMLVEWLARDLAEDAVKIGVQSNLPDNVEANVDVEVGGDWVIFQYLSGTMDEVTISDEALVDGVPVALSITASEVPTDLATSVGTVEATATVGPDTLNSMFTLPGNDPVVSLGEGTLVYADSTNVFGVDIGYQLTTTPQPDGTDVLLTRQGVEVTSSVGALDLTGIADQILGGEPVRVCMASHLPVGITIESIDVEPAEATLVLVGHDVELSGGALATRGTCE
ncbi:hypothetical protein GCM10027416_23730 [Okibacterium endophyticum]